MISGASVLEGSGDRCSPASTRPSLFEILEHAACKGMGPDAFFSEDGLEEARAICAACPVVKTCLEYARLNSEQGFWGGMTEGERKGRIPKPRPLECSVDECPRVPRSRGMCDLHYQRWRRYGKPGQKRRSGPRRDLKGRSVRFIVDNAGKGCWSQAALARRYKVSETTISKVLRRARKQMAA